MKQRKLLRGVLAVAFACCIVYITVFARSASLSRELGTELFQSVRKWMAGDRNIGLGIVLNIGMFIPFGYLTASFFAGEEEPQKTKSLFVLLLGFLLSLAVELVQFRTGRGTCEVDDLIYNTAGTAIGLLFYRIVSPLAKKKGAGKGLVYGLFPALMIVSGVLGGWQISRMVVMTNLKATEQFWFSVDQVEGDSFNGRCYLYDGETPEFQILLSDGSQTLKAESKRDGEAYSATAARTEGTKYEIQVRFRGFGTLPTGVYLNGGKVEYVDGQVQVPAEAENEPLLADADLKACSEEWDCYVFQSGNELIWLVGSGVSDTTELICHLHTNKPEQLPEQRVEYGFDNLGFLPTQPDQTIGSYRCFVRSIPTEYPVTEIIVGLNPGSESSEIVWNSAFRP